MPGKKYIGLDGKPVEDSGIDTSNLPVKKYIELGAAEPYKDPITAASEKVAPLAGRVATESLPAIGSFAGPGGTLIGTGISQMIKRARPDLFGDQPQGLDAAVDAGKELLLNNALPFGLGKLGKLAVQTTMMGPKAEAAYKLSNFPAVREGVVKQLTEAIRGQLGENYQPLGDSVPISVKPKMADYQPITITPGKEPRPYPKFQLATDPTVAADGAPISVKSGGLQVIPGVLKKGPDDLGKLLGSEKLDTGKMLEELGKKDYSEMMPTDILTNTKSLLGTMRDLQEKNITDRVISYSKGKLVWTGAALLHNPFVAAGAGTPLILNKYLGKIMQNPETAKLVTAALTTPAKAPEATLINKALMEILPRVVQGSADLAATPDH